jgi:hypothetical protein
LLILAVVVFVVHLVLSLSFCATINDNGKLSVVCLRGSTPSL